MDTPEFPPALEPLFPDELEAFDLDDTPAIDDGEPCNFD